MFMHLAGAQWRAILERLEQKLTAAPDDKAILKIRDRITAGLTDSDVVCIEGQVPGFRMLAEWIDAGQLRDVANQIRMTCVAVEWSDNWESVDLKMGMAQ